MITFFKRAWPALRFFGRAPVPRANFLTTETGAPITTETGEVITIS